MCHHGGAGTTSAGLRAGLPTIIIPFFGDQKFWGTAVALAGAGPQPIPYKHLTADKLTAALEFALSDAARQAAGVIGQSIRAEDGTKAGVDSFHAHLPLNNMRCDLEPYRAAQWWSKKHYLRLSSFAAGVLVRRGVIKWRHLVPLREFLLLGIPELTVGTREYDTSRTYTDPITAGSQALLGMLTTTVTGTAQLFTKQPVGSTSYGRGANGAAKRIDQAHLGHCQGYATARTGRIH